MTKVTFLHYISKYGITSLRKALSTNIADDGIFMSKSHVDHEFACAIYIN